jgi:hypothetical protein
MSINLEELVQHDSEEDCPVCRTQDLIGAVLLPAAAAWESSNGLPRFSLALHGAVEFLGAMLAEGVPREDVDGMVARLLDEVEIRIAEDAVMGGPPQGSA